MATTPAAQKCADKMVAHKVNQSAISAFLANHKAVEAGETGAIAEADIEPTTDLPYLNNVSSRPSSSS